MSTAPCTLIDGAHAKTSGGLPVSWTCKVCNCAVFQQCLSATARPSSAFLLLPLYCLFLFLSAVFLHVFVYAHIFLLTSLHRLIILSFSTQSNCLVVERYTDPSNKTLNISKVNMKHSMSKKMDRFITAMTQFAGLRMKVSSMHPYCVSYTGHLALYWEWLNLHPTGRA